MIKQIRTMAWMVALGAMAGTAHAQARLIAGTETSLPRIVTSYGDFALGKKPYPEGTREKWIAEGRVLAQAPEGYLPPSKRLKGASDNRSYLPPIGNQGSLGSCVHWAGTYYTKSANMKRMNPALNLSATSNQCSPKFTYNLTNTGADNGGYGHEPFEIFMRYGVASLAQLPYNTDYTSLPTVANFVEGLHRRSTNYVWVWEWNPTTTQINQLKAWLDAGGVASCGVYAENSFDAWGKGDAPWVGSTCTINNINHMVTVFGYGPGYYLVANSWGTSFGSNGYIVVDSAYFEDYFSDVLFPLEGTYEPATNYVKMSISHARRSDLRSLQFSVNGATVWSNSPLPKNLPKGTGSFDTDSRANWQLAVDLSSAAWGGANTVTSKCTDNVSGTTGSVTNFTLRYMGADFVSTNTPVSIPDNSTAGAIAVVATATATSAPSFGANPGPLSATTGAARVFTVTAGGYPAPVLALQSTTASSGHSFVPGTGELTYTPPVADVGARSFTFTASNSAGVATQTVNVTVVQAPPAAPASIWASATNTADFTAAWSSVADAADYRLDVGTNSSFSTGGGGGGILLSENFAGFTVLAGSTDRSGALNTYLQTPGWTGAAVYENAGEAKMGSSSARGILVSPALDLSANGGQAVFTFDARYYSGTDASVVQVHVAPDGVNFVQSGVDIALTPDMTTYTHPITNGTASCKVRVYALNAASERYYIDNWQIAQLGGDPNFVPGYSNRTVSGTSQSVTGLAAGATYYFRARAVNGGGTSPNTSVASVTTLATLSAPVFGANPGPVATTAGVATAFTVSASGVPAPALALQSQTATSGYSFDSGTGELAYTPPQADAGTRTFTFSASNSQGTASQTVTVNVAAATAPVFTGGAGPYSTTVGVAVAFTVSASGTPAATLALAGQTASGGYSFNPASGSFTYTPPVGDVGAPTFTFTAANAAGTVTQVTSVGVAPVPTAPAAPAAIWASATNATDFTAAWSAASGADGYRLDVATNDTFSGGGGGGGSTLVSENIQSWTVRASYGTWTQTIPAGTVNMTRCIVAPAAGASGVGSIGRVQLEASTGILELPALDTVGSIAMNIVAGAAGRTVKLQRYNGSTWDDLATWSGIGTTGAAFTCDVNDSGSGVRLRVASPSAAIYVHDITVTSSWGECRSGLRARLFEPDGGRHEPGRDGPGREHHVLLPRPGRERCRDQRELSDGRRDDAHCCAGGSV
jgi:hypothetical protein